MLANSGSREVVSTETHSVSPTATTPNPKSCPAVVVGGVNQASPQEPPLNLY